MTTFDTLPYNVISIIIDKMLDGWNYNIDESREDNMENLPIYKQCVVDIVNLAYVSNRVSYFVTVLAYKYDSHIKTCTLFTCKKNESICLWVLYKMYNILSVWNKKLFSDHMKEVKKINYIASVDNNHFSLKNHIDLYGREINIPFNPISTNYFPWPHLYRMGGIYYGNNNYDNNNYDNYYYDDDDFYDTYGNHTDMIFRYPQCQEVEYKGDIYSFVKGEVKYEKQWVTKKEVRQETTKRQKKQKVMKMQVKNKMIKRTSRREKKHVIQRARW